MLDPTRSCDMCGQPVGPRKYRFCSKSCQARHGRRRRGEVQENARSCEACSVPLSGRQSNARFCSHRCNSWALRNPGLPHPSSSRRTCMRCGVDISDRDVRSPFCSPTCRNRVWAGCLVDEYRVCSWCGQPFLARRRSMRFCSSHCCVRADHKTNRVTYVARAKERRARLIGASVEKFSHIEVFERDGWSCYLCGGLTDRLAKWPDLHTPSLDHVVPLSRGGEHSMQNTRCAHLGCNLSKGARLMA